MEKLIAGGAKAILAVGCCGVLDSRVTDKIIVVKSALRGEGVSYQYLPPAREVSMSKKMNERIIRYLKDSNIPYAFERTWTTCAYYRETRKMVEYRKAEGFAVVEMECASMASCAILRNVDFSEILFSADSFSEDVSSHYISDWGNGIFEDSLVLAIEIMKNI